jgi:hypothetical protein
MTGKTLMLAHRFELKTFCHCVWPKKDSQECRGHLITSLESKQAIAMDDCYLNVVH